MYLEYRAIRRIPQPDRAQSASSSFHPRAVRDLVDAVKLKRGMATRVGAETHAKRPEDQVLVSVQLCASCPTRGSSITVTGSNVPTPIDRLPKLVGTPIVPLAVTEPDSTLDSVGAI